MKELEIFGIIVPAWITVPLVFLLWLTLFLYIKKIIFRAIKRISAKTKTQFDDILIQSLDIPLNLIIFTSGAAFIEPMIPTVFEGGFNADLTKYFLVTFKAITIVAVILFADKFINQLFQHYSNKVDILRTSGGVARGFTRVLVIGLGLLILLDSFGVSITPVIASLGIGSLAVALALQPTLENFFSGIQLVIDKPIKVGHFVKLESEEEGYVHKIGWRSTWIKMLPNNMVVIPNSSLVKSKIINYYYPDTELAVLVQVGVHYNSDLELVERVTIEVAKETLQEVTGGVKSFEPFIRYHTFDSSSINFTVILRGEEFVAGYLIKHEFIKKLHKRYNEENITIPFPIRAINLDQEGADQILKMRGKA